MSRRWWPSMETMMTSIDSVVSLPTAIGGLSQTSTSARTTPRVARRSRTRWLSSLAGGAGSSGGSDCQWLNVYQDLEGLQRADQDWPGWWRWAQDGRSTSPRLFARGNGLRCRDTQRDSGEA